MENNGKSLILQRTLGAAVLIAATATLVPLVLDGEGIKASREQVNIPGEPTFELQLDESRQPKIRMLQARGAIERAEQDAISAVALPDEETAETGVVPEIKRIVENAVPESSATNPQEPVAQEVSSVIIEKTTPAAKEATAKDIAKPEVAKVVLNEAKPRPPQSMEDVIQRFAQPAASMTTSMPPKPSVPTPMPSVTPTTGLSESWTIQMGAFKDRVNAQKAVSQLVAKGYRAYLGTQTPGVYRVFVGPEIRRDRADFLRDRVATDTGTRGVVVRYVP